MFSLFFFNVLGFSCDPFYFLLFTKVDKCCLITIKRNSSTCIKIERECREMEEIRSLSSRARARTHTRPVGWRSAYSFTVVVARPLVTPTSMRKAHPFGGSLCDVTKGYL